MSIRPKIFISCYWYSDLLKKNCMLIGQKYTKTRRTWKEMGLKDIKILHDFGKNTLWWLPCVSSLGPFSVGSTVTLCNNAWQVVMIWANHVNPMQNNNGYQPSSPSNISGIFGPILASYASLEWENNLTLWCICTMIFFLAHFYPWKWTLKTHLSGDHLFLHCFIGLFVLFLFVHQLKFSKLNMSDGKIFS